MPHIARRMLTETLRHLARRGLVSRELIPSTPPAVNYGFTAPHSSLMPPLSALIRWAEENQPRISATRARFEDRGLGG
jgi:DNA-binding HxlR family transcriptional regulator